MAADRADTPVSRPAHWCRQGTDGIFSGVRNAMPTAVGYRKGGREYDRSVTWRGPTRGIRRDMGPLQQSDDRRLGVAGPCDGHGRLPPAGAWSWVDAFYFSAVAVTTVGFGDLAPSTDASKLFTVLYIFSGVAIITLFLNDRLRRRERRVKQAG